MASALIGFVTGREERGLPVRPRRPRNRSSSSSAIRYYPPGIKERSDDPSGLLLPFKHLDTEAESMTDAESDRARLVGMNHVALEVEDIEEALSFYDSLFEYDIRGRGESSAFIDMGDQFIALAEHEEAGVTVDDHRHVGIVVDDRSKLETRLEEEEVDQLDVPGIEFRDPWGNRIQVVEYRNIQFTKAEHVLQGMGLDLEKSESAIEELAEKGVAPADQNSS